MAKIKLLLLAAVMVAVWLLAAPASLTTEEQRLWERVRAAQLHLAQWRRASGADTPAAHDPWQSGLIGVQWSAITTTAGDLAAKRTACNPSWALQFNRWFDALDLKRRDPIAIFSSGSFPGMLLSALSAAESKDLKVLLIVSLGASTWGANHPQATWPVMAAELDRMGFVHKRADFYTLGGGGEMGRGLPAEGAALLRKAAAGVELIVADDLERMVTRKTELLLQHKPKAFINIGGSHANLGEDPGVLGLPNGLVPFSAIRFAGSGVIGNAMRNGVPVIHILNLKGLCVKSGLPYDSPPRKAPPVKAGMLWCGIGLLFYLLFLWRHRRWQFDGEEKA